MVIGHHVAEPIDVVPDMCVSCVKNVWPIDMHHDTVVATFCVCIATNVRATVNYPRSDTRFC